MKRLVLLIAAAMLPALAAAQATMIADARKMEWSSAGVKGGIPYRTKVCANLTPSNTLSQINSAISSCPAGQVVQFAAGTYNLSGLVLVSGKSNITLRGAGPMQTVFVMTSGGSCNGLTSSWCVRSTNRNDIDSPGTVVNWTAGYAKGTTQITLSSTSNLQVDSILLLDQVNDSSTDNNAIWMNTTSNVTCLDCGNPGRGSGSSERSQVQAVRVTAINGNQVTIDPAVAWPNFTSSKSPQAWYVGAANKGIGIEDITINSEGGTGAATVFFANVTDSWLRNVRLLHLGQKGVWAYQTIGVTLRDSYMYDKRGADSSQEGSESYGFDCYLCSMSLVENNIAHHITAPWQCESGVGNVFAYNYTFDDFYNLSNSDWAQASSYTHGACAYTLHEGNHGFGMIQDIVHAPNYLHTAFRNRFEGWETGRSLQTVPIHIYAPNRYSNIVGNVLGTASYHSVYESYPGGPGGSCVRSIFALGWGGNCGNSSIANKANVRTSLMRWGNWDTVTQTARFQADEIPSSDANYPNPVPSDQALPASFYLTRKPMRYPESVPWPAVGPDISGGDVSNVGGRAHSIPAKRCWDTGTKVSGILQFDANSCYGAVEAPSNLR